MKDNILYGLAVGGVLLVGYSTINYGLISTSVLITAASTLWFGILTAFSNAPVGPTPMGLPFFSAYPKQIYLAAYVSLLFGAVTLVCTHRGVFFVIDSMAALTLTIQWWHSVRNLQKK